MAKYDSVNRIWPEGTNEGRNIILSDQECMALAKRLYRKAFGKPFKGKIKITSGRNYTYVRSHVLYVNPNQTTWQGNGGLHEIVHGISHLAARRLWNEAHGPNHATIERDLIDYVINNGFHLGKLKSKAKPKPDRKTKRVESIATRIKKWEAKRKRAETALRKLNRAKKRYDRQLTA